MSELVTVIISYLTQAGRQKQLNEEGKYSGRPVPDGGKVSYLFRVFFFSFSFPLPEERPPCFLELKVSRQGLSGCAEVRR